MQEGKKIFIVGIESIDKHAIANEIVKKDDSMTICPMFTSDITKRDLHSPTMYYLDNDTVTLSFKNNSIMFVTSNEVYSEGMTLDDMYNSTIAYMSVSEFNTIPEKQIESFDLIVIWVDTKKHSVQEASSELYEVKYFQEFLDKNTVDVMYFLDEPYDVIADAILEFVYGDEEKRKQLIEENN